MIGRLEVGTKQTGAEQHHWQEVINCPRKQIAEWHKLKEGGGPAAITEWNMASCDVINESVQMQQLNLF